MGNVEKAKGTMAIVVGSVCVISRPIKVCIVNIRQTVHCKRNEEMFTKSMFNTYVVEE